MQPEVDLRERSSQRHQRGIFGGTHLDTLTGANAGSERSGSASVLMLGGTVMAFRIGAGHPDGTIVGDEMAEHGGCQPDLLPDFLLSQPHRDTKHGDDVRDAVRGL